MNPQYSINVRDENILNLKKIMLFVLGKVYLFFPSSELYRGYNLTLKPFICIQMNTNLAAPLLICHT